jgi:CBS domain-containing protein
VLGVVSEADLLLKEEFPDPDQDIPLFWTRRRRMERAKAAASTAADLMTVGVVSISGDASVPEAARRMHTAKVKRLPVVVRAVHGVEGVVRVENRLAYDINDIEVARSMTYPWAGGP